jgi:hypothetical protein
VESLDGACHVAAKQVHPRVFVRGRAHGHSGTLSLPAGFEKVIASAAK